MKRHILISGSLSITLLAAALVAQAADSTVYSGRPGGKMRIEGTSSVHDWQAESSIIGGSLEVGPGFPTEPGQAVQPGKIAAKGAVFVPVMSLKSLEKDGRPYSDDMNDKMWEHLKSTEYGRIVYHLSELVLKEAAKDKDSPYVFDSKGELVVAGVTNAISMPVNVFLLPDKKLKITGTTTVKMSAFKIEPPAPKLVSMLIKTGDDVKVIFDWVLAQKSPAAAAK